jgi:ribosomal protein S8
MSNYIIGDLISRLRVALNGHLSRIKVLNSKISLNILAIFYENGLICGYQIENQFIMVYLKYYKNLPVFLNIKLISTPGKKVY